MANAALTWSCFAVTPLPSFCRLELRTIADLWPYKHCKFLNEILYITFKPSFIVLYTGNFNCAITYFWFSQIRSHIQKVRKQACSRVDMKGLRILKVIYTFGKLTYIRSYCSY